MSQHVPSLVKFRSLRRGTSAFSRALLGGRGLLSIWVTALLRIRFEHTKCASGATRRRFERAVERFQQSKELGPHFDDVAGLRHGLLALLLLDLAQLGREVVGLEGVDDGEEEDAVAGRIAAIWEIGQVAEHSWFRDGVGEDLLQGQLLVAGNFDRPDLAIGEAALAAVQNAAQVVHGAEAPLGQVQLAYTKMAPSQKIAGTYL